MFCENCGNKLQEGFMFCTNCGHKIAFSAPPFPSEMTEETISVSEPKVAETETKIRKEVEEKDGNGGLAKDPVTKTYQIPEIKEENHEIKVENQAVPPAEEPIINTYETFEYHEEPNRSFEKTESLKATKKEKSPMRVMVSVLLGVFLVAIGVFAVFIYTLRSSDFSGGLDAAQTEKFIRKTKLGEDIANWINYDKLSDFKLRADDIEELLTSDKMTDRVGAMLGKYADAIASGDYSYHPSAKEMISLVKALSPELEKSFEYRLDDYAYERISEHLNEADDLESYRVGTALRAFGLNYILVYMLFSDYFGLVLCVLAVLLIFDIFLVNRRRIRGGFLVTGVSLTLTGLSYLLISQLFGSVFNSDNLMIGMIADSKSALLLPMIFLTVAGLLGIGAYVLIGILHKNSPVKPLSKGKMGEIVGLCVNAGLILLAGVLVTLCVLNVPDASVGPRKESAESSADSEENEEEEDASGKEEEEAESSETADSDPSLTEEPDNTETNTETNLVEMPDVIGLSSQSAQAWINQIGLIPEIEEVPSGEPMDTIILQTVASGTLLEKGARVFLQVSDGSLNNGDDEEQQGPPDFIFWDSDVRLLTEEELRELTDEELRIARNEIYARHGHQFKGDEVQAYFDSKEWYQQIDKLPIETETVLFFQDIEQKNVATIKKIERERRLLSN